MLAALVKYQDLLVSWVPFMTGAILTGVMAVLPTSFRSKQPCLLGLGIAPLVLFLLMGLMLWRSPHTHLSMLAGINLTLVSPQYVLCAVAAGLFWLGRHHIHPMAACVTLLVMHLLGQWWTHLLVGFLNRNSNLTGG